MNEFHPRVINQLLQQLPMGTAITRVDALSNPTSTTLNLYTDGAKSQMVVPKLALSERFPSGEVHLIVEEGQTVNEVVDLLSQKYDLFWVQNVDYHASDDLVVFDETGEVPLLVKAADTSPLWYGEVKVILLDKAAYDRPTEAIAVPLDTVRLQMALTSVIFQGDGKVFNKTKTKLTPGFCKKVYTHLKDKGFTAIGPDDIGNGELIDNVTDGFSGMIVVKPVKGPHLFIRFRSKGEDLVPSSPGDEDPV